MILAFNLPNKKMVAKKFKNNRSNISKFSNFFGESEFKKLFFNKFFFIIPVRIKFGKFNFI
jgi:hypothetical protein